MKDPRFLALYRDLLRRYGLQGWWPVHASTGAKPDKTGSVKGYHPGDYTYPRTERQRFEIAVGAILTQNTAWTQAEKAVDNLHRQKILQPDRILAQNPHQLAEVIKTAGFPRQKARKLQELALFWKKIGKTPPTRDELLSVWGIGPETADSILLYAFHQPTFVIDAYTRRITNARRLLPEKASYEEARAAFQDNLPPSVPLYQEYHALLVEHAKRLRRA